MVLGNALLPERAESVLVTATAGGPPSASVRSDPFAARVRLRLVVLTASLGASVVVFTLLLRATTLLLPVPRQAWAVVSGMLLVALGFTQLAPSWWERVSLALRLPAAHRLLPGPGTSRGLVTAAVAGAALGPVFSSCSPLYGYVVATVLPASVPRGLALLLAYVTALCATLLAIAIAGRRVTSRLWWAADPRGRVRRAVGVVLLLVGVAILLGWDKTVETWAVENLPLIGFWTFDAQFLPQS